MPDDDRRPDPPALRDRQEVVGDLGNPPGNSAMRELWPLARVIIEVLLDIRDLLAERLAPRPPSGR